MNCPSFPKALTWLGYVRLGICQNVRDSLVNSKALYEVKKYKFEENSE